MGKVLRGTILTKRAIRKLTAMQVDISVLLIKLDRDIDTQFKKRHENALAQADLWLRQARQDIRGAQRCLYKIFPAKFDLDTFPATPIAGTPK